MHSDVCVMKNNKIKIYLIGSTRVAFYQRERESSYRKKPQARHDVIIIIIGVGGVSAINATRCNLAVEICVNSQ